MKSLLSGIRVLDLTRYFPGPFATLRLQERGAEIIKIEDPQGEPGRFIGAADGKPGAVFQSMSRGKQCVSMNMKDPADLEKFYELVKGADVLLESFRPGVSSRLKIDYAALREINPQIVYISLTGYGQNGPMAKLAGHDLNYMATSGLLDQLLDESGKPIHPQVALADLIAGMAAEEAVLSGLVNRFKNGSGSYHDVSMTDAVLSFMGLHVTHHSLTGEEHAINDHGIGYGVFETSDGRFMTLCAMEEKFFVNFCMAVGREDLLPYHQTPANHENPYFCQIEEIFKTKTFEEWKDFALKVDCCMSPVLKTGELADSDYVKQRGMIEEKWGTAYVATAYHGDASFLNFDRPYEAVGASNDILK